MNATAATLTTVVTSVERGPVSAEPCKICNRQFAKYACPRCNIPYCSLTCFRSEKHSQCSEGFYRGEIQSDIKTAPSATAQERSKMMELLKRFEESNGEEEDEVDEEDALAQSLNGVDLDSVSPDDLWDLLTEEKREEFMKLMKDPSSEVVKQLLADSGSLDEQFTPWWRGGEDPRVKRPTVMVIPCAMVEGPLKDGPSLVYNICAVCIVYAYVSIHFQVSPLTNSSEEEAAGMKDVLSNIAHFITDRKSTVVYASLSSVVTDIWSRLGENEASPDSFSLLLEDASLILRPRVVTEVKAVMEPDGSGNTIPDSHPNESLLLALSDLAKLYGGSGDSGYERPAGNKRDVATNRKLGFYTARVVCMSTMSLRGLADEVLALSRSILVSVDRSRLAPPLRPQSAIEEL